MSQSNSEEILDRGEATFSSDSKLLSEIGERLIATADIALAELIKNSYDADATQCHIWFEDNKDELIVKDNGHGMRKQEFLNYWMTVATTSRLEQETSKKYNRDLTGAKGVGRFAVRNLGLELELSSVAYYEDHDEYRRLIAEFEWADFESGEALREENVEYRIIPASEEEEGTELRITDLQKTWTEDDLEEVSGEVLDIISAPYETNQSELNTDEEETDPGFSVYFAPPGEESPKTSAAKEIYERYVAQVDIEIKNESLRYEYEYPYGYEGDEAEERTYEFDLDQNLVGDIVGEIRYFHHGYTGVFKGMNTIDGRKVSSWFQDNGGIRVIDKNFRVPPYGDQNNDWLNISESHARREREWRSTFVSNLFPGDEVSDEEIKNRQLNLPRKNQLIGSIHVSSYRPSEDGIDRESVDRLMPAMDRQGFVENEAMNQLRDVARGAIEIFGILDREEKLRRDKQEAKETESELKDEIDKQREQIEEELDSVVEEFENESTSETKTGTSTESEIDTQLSFGDSVLDDESDSDSDTEFLTLKKTNITSGDERNIRQKVETEIKPEIEDSYNDLKEKIEEYEEARAELRSSVESMYLMSAVSAFMTHETSELLRSADEMIEVWEAVPEEERSEELQERLEVTREARDKFDKQLGYAKRFMEGLEKDEENELYVKGKVDEVVEQFDHYTDRKDIEIEHEYPRRLQTPPVNPSIYTGLLMNLFTNAIKAVLDVAPEGSGRIIRFEAENTDYWHKIRVADTGKGIPDGLQDRIFDPLFSTTESREDDPLGAGVGLGLYVVKRVVESSDGEIAVVEPPEGFETCFEVKFER